MAPGGGYDRYDMDILNYLDGLQAIDNLRNNSSWAPPYGMGSRDQWLQGQDAQLNNTYADRVASYWTKPRTGGVSFAPGGFGPEGRWSNRAEDAWIQPEDTAPNGNFEIDRSLTRDDWKGLGHPLVDYMDKRNKTNPAPSPLPPGLSPDTTSSGDYWNNIATVKPADWLPQPTPWWGGGVLKKGETAPQPTVTDDSIRQFVSGLLTNPNAVEWQPPEGNTRKVWNNNSLGIAPKQPQWTGNKPTVKNPFSLEGNFRNYGGQTQPIMTKDSAVLDLLNAIARAANIPIAPGQPQWQGR